MNRFKVWTSLTEMVKVKITITHKFGTATNVISDMPLNLISYKHHKAINVIMRQTS